MAIKKQEFYEGAALHRLARTGKVTGIGYDAPFFWLNNCLLVRLKYSTKGRSPWAFTFTADEQLLLQQLANRKRLVIGLICGADGIVALSYEAYRRIASTRKTAVHIACYRRHGKHYRVSGPDGSLSGKIAPSDWQRILDLGDDDEAQ
jgi:hypothetical protein